MRTKSRRIGTSGRSRITDNIERTASRYYKGDVDTEDTTTATTLIELKVLVSTAETIRGEEMGDTSIAEEIIGKQCGAIDMLTNPSLTVEGNEMEIYRKP